mmetsp:Transcript_12479/g.27550  ORF Transcript_12479/g.27550 Transcript_12479/m.27550 type:complete len:85 (-) Transcript_12479:392-646(-)
MNPLFEYQDQQQCPTEDELESSELNYQQLVSERQVGVKHKKLWVVTFYSKNHQKLHVFAYRFFIQQSNIFTNTLVFIFQGFIFA